MYCLPVTKAVLVGSIALAEAITVETAFRGSGSALLASSPWGTDAVAGSSSQEEKS